MLTEEYIDKYVKLCYRLDYLYLLKPEAENNIIYQEITGGNYGISVKLKTPVVTDWGYIHDIGITNNTNKNLIHGYLLNYLWADSWKDLYVKVDNCLKEFNISPSDVHIREEDGPGSYTLHLERRETDEEFKARLELFEKYLPYAIKNKENEERQAYEKLKSKFG